MNLTPLFLAVFFVGATFGFYIGYFIGHKELTSLDDNATPQPITESRER